MKTPKVPRRVLRALDAAPPRALPRRVHERRAATLRGTLSAERGQGRLPAMRAVARTILRHVPDDEVALEALRYAEDALRLGESGYPEPPLGSTPYTPDPRSVVSVLSQSLPIRTGGYATRSHGILTALADRGWDIAAVTRLGFPYDRWPEDDERTVEDVDVVGPIAYHRALDPLRRRYPQQPLEEYVEEFADHVERLAVERRASAIHASSFYATGLGAATAARRLGLPFVYELRGLEDLMRGARSVPYRTSSARDFVSRMETDVCHLADRVMVITGALREEMIARGVPAEKISVLPNGVHVDDFVPQERDAELEAELGVQGRTVIGYAGSLVHYEGLGRLLSAVAQLRAERDDFTVLVVGDGAAQSALLRRAEDLGVLDVVRFTGRVSHEEVPRYLSLFDITPFPRLPLPVCQLISPMKPFEAMASGKAVVVSDVAALTEIVTDGETGLTFRAGSVEALAEVLGRLLDDVSLRERLGSAARDWVIKERDWSTVAAAADDVYRELIRP